MNKKLRRLLGRRKNRSSDIEEKNKRNKKTLSSLLCERNNAEPNQYLSGQKGDEIYTEAAKEKLDDIIPTKPDRKDDLDLIKSGEGDLPKPKENWSELTVEIAVENSDNVNKDEPKESCTLLGNVAPSNVKLRSQENLLYNKVPEAKNNFVVSTQPCAIWPVTQHLIPTATEGDSVQKAVGQAQTSNEEILRKYNTYTNEEMALNIGMHDRNSLPHMETLQDNNLKRSMNDRDWGWLSVNESQVQEVNNNKMMILDHEMDFQAERNCNGCQKRHSQRLRHRHHRHCGSCHHHSNHHRKILRCSSQDHGTNSRQHMCTAASLDTNCCRETRHSCTACGVRGQMPETTNKRYSSAVLFTITDDNVAFSNPRVVEFSQPRPSHHLNLQQSHHGDPEEPGCHHGGVRAFKRHLDHVINGDAVDDYHEEICHCCGNNNIQFCNPVSHPFQQHNYTANIKPRISSPSTSGLNQSVDHTRTHPDNMPPALSLDRSCHHGCWCNDSLTHKPEYFSSGFLSSACSTFENNFCRQTRNVTSEKIAQHSLAHFSLSKRAYARLISYCHTKKLLTDVYPGPTETTVDPLRSMHNSSNASLRFINSELLHNNSIPFESRRVRTIDSSAMELCRLGKVFETVEECPWYWGPLSGQDAKKKLRGTAPGTFLLRDSSDSRFLFSLSLKTEQGPTSIRIVYQDGLFRFDSENDNLDGRKRSSKKSSKSNDKKRQCVVRMILHYTYHLSKSLENLSISDSETINSSRDKPNPAASVFSSTASGGNGARSQFMCFWVDQGGRKEIPVALSHPLTTGCKTLEHLARSRISKHYRLWDNTNIISQLQLPEMLKNSLRKYPYPI